MKKSRLITLFVTIILISNMMYAQTDSSDVKMSFDFGITRSKNINLFPIFKIANNERKSSLQILYPLFSRTDNYHSGKKHFHIFPIYYKDSNENCSHQRYLSLYYPSVFHYKYNFSSQSKHYKFIELAPSISLLGVSKSAKGLSVENNFFFFISYNRNDLLKKTRLTVFPLYWYTVNNTDTTHLVPGLFYSNHNANSTKLNIALLYNFNRNDSVTKNTLFPLYWQEKRILSSDTILKRTLFPMYFAKESNDYSYRLLFPFIYKERKFDYSSFSLFPLFSYGKSNISKKRHIAITPFYWYLKNEDEKHNIFFPILHTFKSDHLRFTFLHPIIYSVKDSNFNSFTAFPFFSYGNMDKKEKKYLVLSPFYWQYKSKTKFNSTLFPIFWHRTKYLSNDTTKNTCLFPIYWSTKSANRSNTVLFPLIYMFNNPDYKSFTLFPIFSFGKNAINNSKYIIATPLFFHSKRYLDNKDSIIRNTFFPIYWSKRTNEVNRKLIFPFAHSYSNKDFKSLTVFPLFSYGNSLVDNKKYLSIVPLYFNQSFVNSNNDSTKFKMIFPLYWAFKQKDIDNKIIFPLIFNLKNKAYKSFSFVPLFSYGKNNEDTKSHLVISPLFYKLKEQINNETVEKRFLLPIYFSEHTSTYKYDLILPIILKQKDKKYQSFTLLPIFHKGKTPNDSLSRLVITPLYWDIHKRTSTDTSRTIRLFPLFKSHKTSFYSEFSIPFICAQERVYDGSLLKYRIGPLFVHKRFINNNDTITKNILFPIFWTYKSSEKQKSVLFPIWFRSNNNHYSSTTLLPLFSYGKAKDSSSVYKMITPLYWSFKNKTDSTNIFLPLYLHHKGKESKTTAFFPFVIHSKATDGKYKFTNILLLFNAKRSINAWNDTISTKTLFSIYFAKKDNTKNNKILLPILFKLENKNYKSFTLFPLISTGKSKKSNKGYLGITPLFWRTYNAEGSKQQLFPIYTYSKTDSQSKFSILLFLLRNEKKENYSKTSFMWPICEGLKSNEKKSFRFAPILWYAKTDSSIMSSVQPFYYNYRDKHKHRFDFMWQVYNYKKKQEISVSNSILWRLAKWENYSNGDFEQVFFYFLYQNSKLNNSKEFCIYPLYHITNSSNGNRTKSVFMSFYNYSKQYIPEINESYEEERIFWVIRLRSNYNKLKAEGKEKYLIKKKK